MAPASTGINGDDTHWQALLASEAREGSRACFRVAYRILCDTAAAEDTCQQAYMKAWEQRGRIQDASALRAWLLRVTVNEALQVLRRRKTERRVLADGVAAHGSKQPQAAPDRHAAVRESVLLALAEVPEPTRTIVVLRLMDGRSGNEVKEIMGCTASEVSRRLHEGIAILRRSLADWATALGEQRV